MALSIAAIELHPAVGAWFTGRDLSGRDPAVGQAGNLAHRRPHLPAELAAARREVARHIGQPADRWHLMRQVHGTEVALVDARTPVGAELRDVDAAVTLEVDRPLVVQVADCVPVLFAGPRTIGVAHAGRAGVYLDVVSATVDALTRLGDPPETIRAVIGPAIGGCCYEVPAQLQDQVTSRVPVARATTTWGTPSLDLPAAVVAQLTAAGVTDVDTGQTACTHGDHRWFSHRRDPTSGRQVGIVVRTGSATGVAA